jgi:PKHD-type hydroxylase
MIGSDQGDVPEWARDRLVLFPAAVSRERCEAILALGVERPLTPGPLYSELKRERIFDPTVRLTSVGWFVEKDWVHDLMFDFAMRVNAVWQFDVTTSDPIQFAVYRRGDFFEWHKDMLRVRQTTIRKISVVLQLDAPDAYHGGKLEFLDNDHGVFVPPSFERQGSVAVFSSLLKHRVTPVKQGQRRSLTAWFKGPPFR